MTEDIKPKLTKREREQIEEQRRQASISKEDVEWLEQYDRCYGDDR